MEIIPVSFLCDQIDFWLKEDNIFKYAFVIHRLLLSNKCRDVHTSKNKIVGDTEIFMLTDKQ